MKKTFTILTLLLVGFTAKAQLIATVQMDETVEGICNQDEVYALYDGFDGQIEPKCSLSKKDMENLLNENLQFLKDNPKFKSKGMVGVYINCEGMPLQWDISVKTKKSDLDAEILKLFQTCEDWTPGTLDSKAVDTRELISYEIKKGVLKIN